MKNYLLSVYQTEGTPPPPDVLEKIMQELGMLRDEMKAAGAWVFSGGLNAPNTATVLRFARGDVLMTDVGAREIERVFREEYGRAVAVLARHFGDIDIAEEAVQDAFTVAVQRWPAAGLPPSPAGWIITTARNRAVDRLRREASREDRHAQAALLHARGDPPEEGTVHDDRLRLIFTCCHPALATGAQVALTLRLLGGLTTAEIAHAFQR